MKITISQLRVHNLKSFRDSGVVVLRPDLNVLVGRNNVGKTALLEALHLINFNHVTGTVSPRIEPARRNYTQYPNIEVTLNAEDQPENFQLSFRGHLYFTPEYKVSFVYNPVRGNFTLDEVAVRHPSTSEWIGLLKASPNIHNLQYQLQELRFSRESPSDRLFDLAKLLNDSTFYMRPHRVTPSDAALATAPVLDGSAQNFHETFLTTCNNSPEVRERVQEFIQQVFEDIDAVLSKVVANNRTAVHVRLKGAPTEIPLSECGTGVEQLLVFAFLVISSKRPLILLWDEPHAFLHPAAERAILKLMAEYPHHQYIVSTHSPVFLNAARPEGVLLITRSAGESTAMTLSSGEQSNLAVIMRELGTTNAELFLSDRVIFVEGPSDGPIFKELLQHLGFNCEGTVFNSIGGEGRLASPKWRDEVIAAYGRFFSGITEIAIPHFFLLDRRGPEHVTRETDLERKYARRVRFLKRREIENYLLSAAAIAEAIRLKSEVYIHRLPSHFSFEWIEGLLDQFREEPKGSKILDLIYLKVGLSYEKTKDGPILARLVNLDDAQRTELQETFGDFLPLTASGAQQ